MDPVAKLLAIEEIKQLKARYFRTMDTRDFDAMAQVFTKDIRFDCTDGSRYTPVGGEPIGPLGPITEGRNAVMAWIRGAFAAQTSCHHGHCHEITIDSETEAHGVIAMEDYIYELDRKTLVHNSMGHYTERYRIEDGAWRIAETKLTRLFSGRDPNRSIGHGFDEPAATATAAE
jgi:hypothetical protein